MELVELATEPPPARYVKPGATPAVWADAPAFDTTDPWCLIPPLAHAYQTLATEWATQPRPAPAVGPRPRLILTACYRTPGTQAKDYAQGRSTPGRLVTNAKPGQSLHNYWPARAFDVAFLDATGEYLWAYQWFARLWGMAKELIATDRIWPLEWGGNWHSIQDYPHFSLAGDSWERASSGVPPTWTLCRTAAGLLLATPTTPSTPPPGRPAGFGRI